MAKSPDEAPFDVDNPGWTVRELTGSEALDVIIAALLENPHPHVRRSVVGALASIGTQRAVEALGEALDDEYTEWRESDTHPYQVRPVADATRALERIAGPQARAILERHTIRLPSGARIL